MPRKKRAKQSDPPNKRARGRPFGKARPLTYSAQACYKMCRRKYHNLYVLAVRKEKESEPLLVGKAFHYGLELLKSKTPMSEVERILREERETVPPWVQSPEEFEHWKVQTEMVVCLVRGWGWRWQKHKVDWVANEQEFNVPFVNPETGKRSATFSQAGKMDALASINGKLVLFEHKTSGEEITPGSDYWIKLQQDTQISWYLVAAQLMGHEVDTIMYDVVRKPTISPKQPLTGLSADDKDALVSSGKYYGRTFPLSEVRFAVGRPDPRGKNKTPGMETPGMFGARLMAEMYTNHGRYFRRQEIHRNEDDLEAARREFWSLAVDLRETEKAAENYGPSAWFRNTMVCQRPYKCEFWEPCMGGLSLDPENLPPGYVKKDRVHEELEDIPDVKGTAPTGGTESATDPVDGEDEPKED